MSDQHPKDIVRLATARNPFEAHTWEQALKDEDIYCKVVGDFLDAGLGDISGVLPEIWVCGDDLHHAEKVLERLQDSLTRSQAESKEQ
jgi:hypothetical protein